MTTDGQPRFILLAITTILGVAFAGSADDWPSYQDQTAARLIADPAITTSDVQEKDYAWADVDNDGDVDLVCVRKQPWNTPGRYRNILFINEGVKDGHPLDGVLVDRSAEFATDATDGGQGFLDATADRDVVLVDVDNDGWLDMVTSTTYGQGLPKSISHPRVYMNKGNDARGLWQGFRYEEPRTPTMPIAPNFCGIGAGYIDDDDAIDLYFVEYNNDLEDRLWINLGTGVFVDESASRMTYEMRESDFGVHAVIADMNDDGVNDIVKDRGSTNSIPPIRISVSYNNPVAEGIFNAFDVPYLGSSYHVGVGDLNNDGRIDIIIDDDGVDRYLLNQGNGGDGLADFISYVFPPESNGFGGNIVVDDINKDGFDDVIIADVDVDCCGCTRYMHFWRNNGDLPVVTFTEETGDIPISARTGTHDVAVFDLNGDSWLDMVIGTCTGMSIWIAEPPIALTFDYPDGLPNLLSPGEPTPFPVLLTALGGAIVPDSEQIHVSVNGGAFKASPLLPQGDDLYLATLPPAKCLDRVRFYLSVQIDELTLIDPPGGAAQAYDTSSATGIEVFFADDIEGDVGGWSVINDPSLLSGAWEQADPNATISGGSLASPEDDATDGAENVLAFVTENGPPGGGSGANDVDGGPTHLISPVLDLAGADARITAARWMFSSEEGVPDSEDYLTVSVSNNNGMSWVDMPDLTTTGTDGQWEYITFTLGDYITPTETVRLRFSVADQLAAPQSSTVEAGIDDFLVERLTCEASCPADLNGDTVIDAADLATLLGAWGPNPSNPADLNTDDLVNAADLAILLGGWGPC